MLQNAARLRDEFDRIALLTPDRPEGGRYEKRLLRYVPQPCESALDIGCGTGSLSRALALRTAHVVAVDLSPNMVSVARQRSSRYPNIEFLVGDFLSLEFPGRPFDCIATVAALHHMSWVPAVERAKELLRAGGMLLIVDLMQDDGVSDRLLSGIAWTLRTLGDLRHRQPPELRDAWADHGRGDSYLTLSAVRRLCHQHLPGAEIRRHLFWRYSVIWRKPT